MRSIKGRISSGLEHSQFRTNLMLEKYLTKELWFFYKILGVALWVSPPIICKILLLRRGSYFLTVGKYSSFDRYSQIPIY